MSNIKKRRKWYYVYKKPIKLIIELVVSLVKAILL